MPLKLLREDITRIMCDAVVNPSNPALDPTGGLDAMIHSAAGKRLDKAIKKLGGVESGQIKVTPAFNLPAKYILHTAGPVWQGGDNGEKELLENCYRNALSTAEKLKCKSVAFPLISSGSYGYPKDKVLKIAVSVITDFLSESDMTVFLVVYDKESYSISEKLFSDITSFIDDVYVGEAARFAMSPPIQGQLGNSAPAPRINRAERAAAKKSRELAIESVCVDEDLSLDEMLGNIDEGFCLTLLRLIDAKGMSDVECYKKANVSKQTWHKIMNDKNYRPSKNTVISFAIALELTLSETKDLLGRVGYALSRSSKFDIIIEYFITRGIYDIFEIDETLFKFDQVTLGS